MLRYLARQDGYVFAKLARKPWTQTHIRRVYFLAPGVRTKILLFSLGVFDPSNSENYPIACPDQRGQTYA
jgi:hypothetical protein